MGIEPLDAALVFIVGLTLGAGYAGMLWITVRRLPRMRYPAVGLISSAALRLTLVSAGLFLLMDGRWERLLIGLAGFTVARFVATRLAVPGDAKPPVNP